MRVFALSGLVKPFPRQTVLIDSVLSWPVEPRHSHESSPSAGSHKQNSHRLCFKGQIRTTTIDDVDESHKTPLNVVIEPLHEDTDEAVATGEAASAATAPKASPRGRLVVGDAATGTGVDSHARRTRWLQQSISVDGERVPGKLLYQCSLDVSPTTISFEIVGLQTMHSSETKGSITTTGRLAQLLKVPVSIKPVSKVCMGVMVI